MTLCSRPESTVRHAFWVGGLLVVLGGLFGMHGLDNHGGGADVDRVVQATMTGTAAVTSHGRMIDTAHKAALATAAVTSATGHDGMDMGMAGMCMAVLVLSLIAVLRLRASRLRPPLWLVARAPRALGFRGRDPDPPSLIQLSIQRC